MKKTEIYLILCENPEDPDGPIVFESYVNKSSFSEAKTLCEAFNKKGRYGKCTLIKSEINNPNHIKIKREDVKKNIN